MGQIIAIRKNDTNRAEGLFGNLMSEAENIMNQRALNKTWSTTDNLNEKTLEKEAEDAIKKACSKVTEFDAKEVRLIAGFKFPDIVAEEFFGVEVKSTKSNQWKSTGSSIVESTRIETVESIYMLFGKLGGQKPEFKCRPYKEVMYDIAVTHSPRYLIDMQLTSGQTIFDKMNCDYDVFRKEPRAIKIVKDYYKKQNKKGQMPWWMDDFNVEPIPLPINIRLWNTLSPNEKMDFKSQLLLLFPEIVDRDYSNAALWLASAKGIVNPSMRDSFTAGGTVNPESWASEENGVPRIWKTLFDCRKLVKKFSEDQTFMPFILEYNPELVCDMSVYEKWVSQIGSLLKPHCVKNKKYKIVDFLLIN